MLPLPLEVGFEYSLFSSVENISRFSDASRGGNFMDAVTKSIPDCASLATLCKHQRYKTD